jgi:hypothetical protein
MTDPTFRMSDAGDNDNVEVEATEEVAEVAEAPRGKLSVEEALEVNNTILHPICLLNLVVMMISKF